MASNIFTGTSRYSADFNSVVERSVAMASLPISQLTRQKETLTTQSTALAGVSSKVAAVRSAITNLNQARTSTSAAISNGAVLTASVDNGALEGTYEIEVVSLGAASIASSDDSLPGVADPLTGSISSSDEFTLTVGASSFEFSLEGDSLSALASAINNLPAAGVRATIVNLGNSSTPDYRLSLQSKKLGDVAIQLNDGSTDLLTHVATGSPATYRVNGQPQPDPIESDTASGIVVGPGVGIDLLSQGTSRLTVGRGISEMSGALSSLAAAYNGLMQEVDKHRGQAGGALSGQAVIAEVSQSARRLVSFAASEDISSLGALGISFDSGGVMSFNASIFSQLDGNDVAEFMGGIDSSGFLQAADGILDSWDDATNGVLSAASTSLTSQISATGNLIAANELRVDFMRERMLEQMAAADALIANLEQQVNYFDGLFAAMKSNAER